MGGLICLGRLDDFLQVLRPFRPNEGRAGLVVVFNEPLQVFFQFVLGTVDALLQAASGQNAKETFDQIHPGGVGRDIVTMHTRMARQPLLRRLVLMNVQII